jgi:hypothetical protein
VPTRDSYGGMCTITVSGLIAGGLAGIGKVADFKYYHLDQRIGQSVDGVT